MAGITRMISPDEALPGRTDALAVSGVHAVLGTSFVPPYPDDLHAATFALGCFWGAERTFWKLPGVFSTGVGYTGGFTPNPTYEETCTGYTGHAESVLVLYRPDAIPYTELLRHFWESHDPTQGMRQGNDVGTEYRSAIFFHDEDQLDAIEASRSRFQSRLHDAGYGMITTEVAPAGAFYFAEEYHQQYLAKHPWGYCGLGGTGVTCPAGVIED